MVMVHARQAGLVASIFLMAACGGGGGKGHTMPAPKVDESSRPEADAGLVLDTEQLSATDNSVRNASSGDTAWSMRMSLNGVEKLNLQGAAISDVSVAVKGMQFSRSDALRLEVTVARASDPTAILATNMSEVAASSPQTAAIWSEQCAGQVSADVDLSAMQIPSKGERTKVQIRVCDFVGFSLKPLVEIKAQAQLLAKRTVIYHCALKVSTSTSEIYTYTDTACPYGYAAEAGETAPMISVLKKYAPGEPLYTTNILVADDFRLNVSNAGTTQLSTAFKAPPFGSHQTCHTQKVDVKYGSPEGIKTARLTFKRVPQADGSTIWMPQNSASWPSMADIKNYYAQAGADEKVHLYRICDWIPEAEDVAAGSVVEFSAQ